MMKRRTFSKVEVFTNLVNGVNKPCIMGKIKFVVNKEANREKDLLKTVIVDYTEEIPIEFGDLCVLELITGHVTMGVFTKDDNKGYFQEHTDSDFSYSRRIQLYDVKKTELIIALGSSLHPRYRELIDRGHIKNNDLVALEVDVFETKDVTQLKSTPSVVVNLPVILHPLNEQTNNLKWDNIFKEATEAVKARNINDLDDNFNRVMPEVTIIPYIHVQSESYSRLLRIHDKLKTITNGKSSN